MHNGGKQHNGRSSSSTNGVSRKGFQGSERTKSWQWWGSPTGPKSTSSGMKFDGDPQQLGFFLAHILTYMQEYSHEIPTEGTRVRVVTLALEGTSARWMVTLYKANTLELWNFNQFMTALRWRFKDSLAN